MKTINTLLFSLMLCIGAMGQTPIMTMTTAKAVGSDISFVIESSVENNSVFIDFGNGLSVSKTVGTSRTTISGTIGNSGTILIYGTNVTRLECSSLELTSLDISNNNALTMLDCSVNKLSTLYIRNNTKLTHLACSYNQLSTLDVTQNTLLYSLSCHGNNLSGLNINNNNQLYDFSCANNDISALDVSQNTELSLLYCNNNKIKTLAINQNLNLKRLNCADNLLTSIDVSKNTNIKSFACNNNLFTFASLPQKQLTWSSFVYAPQKPFNIEKNFIIKSGIDLSSQLSFNGNTTNYVWKTKSGTKLSQGTDYSLNNGVTIFIKSQPDSVYCEMTNASFPDLPLNTSNTKIEETPFMKLITAKAIGSDISFYLQSSIENNIVQIDFGDGILIDKLVGASRTLISGTITGSQTIKIIGTDITTLECESMELTSLDVSGNKALTNLNCFINKLSTLDVSANKKLTNLICDYNQLSALDVTRNTLLRDLHCQSNKLSVLDLTQNTSLRTLGCSGNNLTTLDVSKNTEIYMLYCGKNQITTIDVSRNTKLIYLTVSDNLLTSINVSKNTSLQRLYCNNNKLTFASIPLKQLSWTNFVYAPQALIPIAKNTEIRTEVDLSSQSVVYGNTTNYVWKTKSGVALSQGADYTINNGKTIFIKSQPDSVYCEMTNASFPNLTLKTTNTQIPEMPTMIITTTLPVGTELYLGLFAKTNNTPVYVDFGDGNWVKKNVSVFSGSYPYVSGTLGNSQTITICGRGLIGLSADNRQIISLDISGNPELRELRAPKNQLTSLNLSNSSNLVLLDCSYNQLTSLDIAKCIALKVLDCTYNQIEQFDVSKNDALETFWIYANKLTQLKIGKNDKLASLFCYNNYLTFATLPINPRLYYAPQNPISITKSIAVGEEADLSSQLTINRKTTVYTWKTKGGTILSPGTDYTITGGKTVFLKSQPDSVYCEMTNATFPNFYGSNALKTTNIKIMEAQPIIGMANSTVNEPLAFAASSQALAEAPKPEPEKEVEPQLTAYPNPVADILYLKGDETENMNVSIFNQSGTKVWSGIVSQQSINIAQLPAGVYILKITSNNNEDKIIRFVKQ